MPTAVDIEQPDALRTRHYGFELDNGAKVIIIRDPTAQKSTAAMGIRTGSHCDPPELPGLAHLCEHMLFLGTEEYPDEGVYNKFISQNGGHSNAYTEDGNTNYYFNCRNDAFPEALKMFLHFFVTPLFTADSLEREVEAVHSEDEKNHSSDYWCLREIQTLHLGNKQHPISRYGNGNKQTLWTAPKAAGVDIRARLLDFYAKYYVADNACLTVYTPLDDAVILDLASSILGRMRRGERTVHTYGVPPVVIDSDPAKIASGEALAPGTWVQMKTNRAVQRLSLYFPIPFSVLDYETRPAAYASHVIGHECEGSLLAVLKQEGLGESLSAGAGHGVDEAYDNFTIHVGLTVNGVRKLDRVVEIVFEAIVHLRKAGIVESVYEEMVASHDLRYNLMEIDSATEHTPQLCRDANRYGLRRCLSAPERHFKRDDAAYKRVIDMLIPSNAVYFLMLQDINAAIDAAEVSPSLPASDDERLALPIAALPTTRTRTSRVTEHHKCHFGVDTVDAALLERWANPASLHPSLSIPKANPFLATDFHVAPLADKTQRLTTETTPHGRVHWKADSLFGTPKAFLAVDLRTVHAYDTGRHRFYVRTAALLLKHALTEAAYFAELGDLNLSVTVPPNGLGIEISGPIHKLLVFAEKVLTTAFDLTTYVTRESDYDIQARRALRALLGWYKEQPYQYAGEVSRAWQWPVSFSARDVLNAAIGPHEDDLAAAACKPPPPFAEFVEFVQTKLFSKVRYEAVVVFNSVASDYPAQAVATLEKVLAGIPVADPAELPFSRDTVQLPSRADMMSSPKSVAESETPLFGLIAHDLTLNRADPNDAAVVAYQCGTNTPRQFALASVTMKLMQSLFFDTLRTTETLGYIVGSNVRVLNETVVLEYVAQSANFNAHYLMTRIHAFIAAMPAYFASLSEEDVQTVAASQISTLQDDPKSLALEGTRYTGYWDHPIGPAVREMQIAELRSICKDDVTAFLETNVSHDSLQARCIVVTLFSKLEALQEFRSHTQEDGFRDLQPLTAKLLPKATPATGKEEIQLPTYEDGTKAVRMLHLGDRQEFVQNEPRVPRLEA